MLEMAENLYSLEVIHNRGIQFIYFFKISEEISIKLSIKKKTLMGFSFFRKYTTKGPEKLEG